MGYLQLRSRLKKDSLTFGAVVGSILLLGMSCMAQEAKNTKPTSKKVTFEQEEIPKTGAKATGINSLPPGLLEALGELYQKLEKNVQFPGERKASRLLPRLPESTVVYAAFPNYGDTAKQALAIFHEEMKENATLRDWMAHGEVAPKIDESLEKFQQVNQFVGDEIVLAGAMDSKEPRMVMLAEAKKPGLKEFLQELVVRVDGKGKSTVRVMDLQDLAAAKEKGKLEDLFVLVRPDFVLAASDLPTLREFNTKLDSGSKTFSATAFAQRVEQGYADGVTMMGAADIHKILSKVPIQKKDEQKAFAQSGFADMKYATWEHTKVEGKPVNKAELSFTGPRHGAAAWLAKPAKLNSLDFVSPEAVMAMSVVLTKPAQVFEDLQELTRNDKSNPFAAIPVMEQALKISVKDDLLNNLDGELTAELDSVGPQPGWRAIWKVNDATRLQATLGTLLTAVSIPEASFDENGVTYYAVKIPNEKSMKLTYAFVDGYWIVGSNPEEVASAVRLHGSGKSLAKDARFLEAVPPGYSAEASGLFFQNPVTMVAAQMKQLAPDMADVFLRATKEIKPSIGFAYGDESSIRMASVSGSTDVTTALVVAAIAIPNLLRSKMAANESSAVGTVRTFNVGQVAYSTMYSKRGYAPNIPTLGPDANNSSLGSAEHANLIGSDLAGENCGADGWCTRSGYQFKLTARCKAHLCNDYVVVATPVSENTGARSFCSTSTGIIHWQSGGPLTAPLSIAKCNEWASIQ